jgi:hypothetical protein
MYTYGVQCDVLIHVYIVELCNYSNFHHIFMIFVVKHLKYKCTIIPDGHHSAISH